MSITYYIIEGISFIGNSPRDVGMPYLLVLEQYDVLPRKITPALEMLIDNEPGFSPKVAPTYEQITYWQARLHTYMRKTYTHPIELAHNKWLERRGQSEWTRELERRRAVHEGGAGMSIQGVLGQILEMVDSTLKRDRCMQDGASNQLLRQALKDIELLCLREQKATEWIAEFEKRRKGEGLSAHEVCEHDQIRIADLIP